MGLLTMFAKAPGQLLKLPSGSFTVDRDGTVLVGTVSSSFPKELVNDIAQQVLATFREAQTANLPLSELIMRVKLQVGLVQRPIRFIVGLLSLPNRH